MVTASHPSVPLSGAARAALITVAYAVFASLWILLSDVALNAIVADPELRLRWSVYKGFAFVGVTALMLFLLVRRGYLALDKGYAEYRVAAAQTIGANRVLSAVASGAPLAESLNLVVRFLEREIPASRCSVLILTEDGQHLRHGAMPSLPLEYSAAIDGSAIGPAAGSCGTAAFLKEAVYVADIATDPRWADYKHLALPHGLRSCWSTPIMDADGECMGTFAIYKGVVALPTSNDERLLGIAGQLASVALSRERAGRALRESESRFNAFMDASPAIAWVTDDEGRHQYMNRGWEQVFGRDRTQWVGRTARELVGDDAAVRIEQSDARVLAEDVPIEVMEERGEIDGRPFVWHLHKFPFKNDAGERFVGGIAIDITERKKAEEALREVEGRLEVVVANLREGLIVSDREGDFVHWNPAALRMIGQHETTPRRQRTSGFYRDFYSAFEISTLDGTPLPKEDWPLARVRRGEQLQEFEVRVRRIGEDWERIFSYSGALVPYASGHELAFLTLSDITERKESERQLRESRDMLEVKVADRTRELQEALGRAESADRLKSAFLATMSHELRTPLNSIIGFTGIVLQGLAGPINAEQTKQLGMVRGSARHLLALINDVLDLSKIEAGQLEIYPEPFDLRESVERSVATVHPLGERKGLPIRLHLESTLTEMVSDKRRVEQILLNLLNNAVKFTDRGAVRLDVTRETSPDGADAVRFTVTDTGIGIRASDLDSLFHPFRQVSTGLTRQHEGTGLGLSICRRLATMLGGTISVTSTIHEGSAFTVVLPRILRLDA